MTITLSDEQQAYLVRMLVEKKIEISVTSTDPYSNDTGRIIDTMPLHDNWYLSRGYGTKHCDLPFMSKEHDGKEYWIEFTRECDAPWLWEEFVVYGVTK
jgi:hypothetical protein